MNKFTDGQDYNNIYDEMSTLQMALNVMTDTALAEECSYLSNRYRTNFLEKIIDKALEGSEKLTEQERKDLEQFYIIIHMDLGFNV